MGRIHASLPERAMAKSQATRASEPLVPSLQLSTRDISLESFFLPPLRAGTPGSRWEQPAHRIAEGGAIPAARTECEGRIQRQPLDEEDIQERGAPGLLRQAAEEEEEEEPLQAKPVQGRATEIGADTVAALRLLPAGRPLGEAERAFFEPRMGVNFGRVRIHSGTQAQKLASNLNARALTYGNRIVVGSGEYSPQTPEGRRLLAHELTHVIQQGRASRLKTLDHGRMSRPVSFAHTAAHNVQFDLAVPPPAPTAVAPQLTEEQLQRAIRYNRWRFKDPYSVAVFRDVIGIPRFPAVADADFARAVARWQAQFRLVPNGRATPATTRTLVRELRGEDLPGDANELRRDNYVTWSDVGAVTRTTPTSASHGRFEWNVSFRTSLRSGWLIQEIDNTRAAVACGGALHPNPARGRYWEAWWVTGRGDVRIPTSLRTPPTHVAPGGHDDGWVRVPLRGTRGTWGIRARLYTALQLPAGFTIRDPAIPWAGDLPATTTRPNSDDLGLVEARRGASGQWDGCPAPGVGPPTNFHRGRP